MPAALSHSNATFRRLLVVISTLFLILAWSFPGRGAAQEAGPALLLMGVQLYSELEWRDAIARLDSALQIGLESIRDQIKAHEYLAFCHAILEDSSKSRTEFISVLKLDPDFDLPLVESPRFLKPLASARKELYASDLEGPNIAFIPPGAADSGKPLNLDALVNDPIGVDSVFVIYSFTSNPEQRHKAMLQDADKSFSAAIDIACDECGDLQLYIKARDRKGNLSRFPLLPISIAVRPRDYLPPSLNHDANLAAVAGNAVEILATIHDPSGVATAEIFYRAVGGKIFRNLPLQRQERFGYAVTIPAADIIAPGIEYFLSAKDSLGNGPATCGSMLKPLRITVSARAEQPAAEPPRQSPPAAATARLQVLHNPAALAPRGQPIAIYAKLSSNEGIDSVIVFYQLSAKGGLRRTVMTRYAANNYQAFIPAAATLSGAISYFISVRNRQGLELAAAGSREKPFMITPGEAALPAAATAAELQTATAVPKRPINQNLIAMRQKKTVTLGVTPAFNFSLGAGISKLHSSLPGDDFGPALAMQGRVGYSPVSLISFGLDFYANLGSHAAGARNFYPYDRPHATIRKIGLWGKYDFSGSVSHLYARAGLGIYLTDIKATFDAKKSNSPGISLAAGVEFLRAFYLEGAFESFESRILSLRGGISLKLPTGSGNSRR